MVGVLGALRMLPEIVGHLLHGERPAKPPESMRLRDLPSLPMYQGGWILLGERAGHEIALGLVGKFWRPVIEWAPITSADEFRAFDEPGFAKTVYDLSVRELDPNRTLLSGLMRTATTDEHARRWFRRYWTFGVGSGDTSSSGPCSTPHDAPLKATTTSNDQRHGRRSPKDRLPAVAGRRTRSACGPTEAGLGHCGKCRRRRSRRRSPRRRGRPSQEMVVQVS